MKKKTVTSETEEITIDNKKKKRKKEKKAYREIRWDRLDNTAHLFPVIAGENMSNVYRISVTLTELVQPDVLQQALNIVLPKMDGFEVCQHIREFSDMPIVMLTAKGDDMDKILGLEYGADDYITKPFNILEVKARIKAIMRRTAGSQPKKEDSKIIEAGDLRLDCESRRLFILDKEVNLTAKEFDLLELLVNNPNKVYSRENLLNLVWGYEYPGDVRTVDVHVRRLREKIEKNPSEPKYVHTKWGVGYYYYQN